MKIEEFGIITERDGKIFFENFIINGKDCPDSAYECCLTSSIERLQKELDRITSDDYVDDSWKMTVNIRDNKELEL